MSDSASHTLDGIAESPAPRWARSRWLAAALLIGCVWPATSHAIDFQQGAVGAALEGIAIDAMLDGRYVSVTVEATINGPSLITGELRFPLPPGAVLYEAAVYVPDDDRWAIAETLGRRQGRQVFDASPSEPRTSPLLVQQIGRDFYRAKVHAPEEADSLRLRIRYAHLIERTPAGYALRIALANPDLGRARPAALGLRIEAPTGWRILGMRGPGLARIEDDRVDLVDPANPLDADLWVDLEPLEPLGTLGGLTYTPAALPEDAAEAARARHVPHTHLHFAPDLPELPAVDRRIVFVLDRSGSMSGRKMEEARRGVARVVERLGPADQFSIVAFNGGVQVFRDTLVGPDQIDAALAFLDTVRAGGGTEIFGALSAAAAIAESAADLILITDGRTGGLADPQQTLDMLGTADFGLRIFSFGIGQNVDQPYLNALALGSEGDVAYALDDGEIAGDLFNLCDGAMRGGLRDAELRVDGVAAWSGHLIPGTELMTGIRGDAPARLELTGQAGPDVLRIAEDIVGLPTGAEGLHRVAAPLVAKTLADRMEREIDRVGETPERVDEAVRLARAYGIITRYSSHLALIDEADYADRGIDRVQRDPAGIALGPVDGAEAEEARIGGAGVDDDVDGDGIDDLAAPDEAPSPPPAGADAGTPPVEAQPGPDGDELTGCTASVGAGPAAPLAVFALLFVMAALGRRRLSRD